jgi:hypothetical protein
LPGWDSGWADARAKEDAETERLEFVEGLVGKVPTGESIWEKIQERVKNVPPEAWADVPRDGSINVDHYLYGGLRSEDHFRRQKTLEYHRCCPTMTTSPRKASLPLF